MRICKVCSQTLPAAAFHIEARVKDGRAAVCKVCTKEKRRGRHTKTSQKHQFSTEKDRARGRLRDAVRYGKILKPDCCQICHAPTLAKLLDGHHEDYSKPLQVTWVCRSCHGAEHLTWKPAA